MEANNKLIAEFMGYKLAKCNNGLAWESPYKKSVEDTFELHGRLWRENDSYYKFHTSWDWLMPVIENIESLGYEVQIRNTDCIIFQLLDTIKYKPIVDISSRNGKKDSTYKAVIEFIKNQNN